MPGLGHAQLEDPAAWVRRASDIDSALQGPKCLHRVVIFCPPSPGGARIILLLYIGDVCAGSFYVNLSQASVIQEKESSTERMPPPNWPIGKTMGHFS